MARAGSDSGLSSSRLGVTSHGGQLATSTPLGDTPGLALKGPTTPHGSRLGPGLQAALQESARVRRRLADELALEAMAGWERGSGDGAGRWPDGRAVPVHLTATMLSALSSPSAAAPSGSSEMMQSCGDGTDSDESGAARRTARRRHSSDGGISGISTISSRSMPEWAPPPPPAAEATPSYPGDVRESAEGVDRGRDRGRATADRPVDQQQRRPRRAGSEGRREACQPAGRPGRTGSDQRGQPLEEDGGVSSGPAQHRGARETADRQRTRQERGRHRARPADQQTPHGEHGHLTYRQRRHQETAGYRGGPRQESRRQGVQYPAAPADSGNADDRRRLGSPETPDQQTVSRRTAALSSRQTPGGPAGRHHTPLAGSVRYLLEHTPAAAGSVVGRPASLPAAAAVTLSSSMTGGPPPAAAADAGAGSPGAERRQLLEAVSGALGCQLADEAGRLRQLQQHQLQELQRHWQLEAEALQNQVAVAEQTLEQTSRQHSRQLASRDTQLTALREELRHVRQQHAIDREKLMSERSRSAERERSALQRRHGRQLAALSQSAAARLTDMAQQHQLATQQLLVTVKSLELELSRRQELLEEERSRSSDLERRLQRLELAVTAAAHSGAGDHRCSGPSHRPTSQPAPVSASDVISSPVAAGATTTATTTSPGPGTDLPGRAAAGDPSQPTDLSAGDGGGLQQQLAAAHQLSRQLRAELQGRADVEAAALERQKRLWEARLQQQEDEHAELRQSEEASFREQMALQSSDALEKVTLLQSQMAMLSLVASGKTRMVERMDADPSVDQSAVGKMDSSTSEGSPAGQPGQSTVSMTKSAPV